MEKTRGNVNHQCISLCACAHALIGFIWASDSRPPRSTIMSQVPPASTSSTNFEAIFTAALTTYNKQTKKDIAAHPLATELQSCDSSGAIIAILRTQIQNFDQSQGSDNEEKWTKWLDPTVKVLFAFSATLGNGVGVVKRELLSRSNSTI